MILTLKSGVHKKDIDKVISKIKELGFTAALSRGTERVVSIDALHWYNRGVYLP